MADVARRMAEELNGNGDATTRVLVVKPVIPDGWFVRDFEGVEWEDDGGVIEDEERRGTLVVPKDPRKRQALSRVLTFEGHAERRRRLPTQRKAIAKFVCENVFACFADENVDGTFDGDDDLSLVADEGTTSFLQIRDGGSAGRDDNEEGEDGPAALLESNDEAARQEDLPQPATTSVSGVPPPFFPPFFVGLPPMRRLFVVGTLPTQRGAWPISPASAGTN